MNELLQQEWFWAMMQFFVVAATLILIYLQVKVQTAAHVVQVLNTMNNRWNSETMLRARHKICINWLNGERTFDGVDQYVAEFMEELGIYLKIKAISDDSLWEAHSWYIDHYFCMFEDGIKKERLSYHDPNLYIRFESMYKKMTHINNKNKSPTFKREEKELRTFAESEKQLAMAFLQLKEIKPAATIPNKLLD